MSFYVKFLGTGSALPTAKSNPSCQYIFCQNRHFLIDCGEGSQIQLRKQGIKLQKIDAIFISHLHGDHYFGLVGLLSSMHLLGRDKAIHIYGPPPLENIVRSQVELGNSRLDFELVFHPIEDQFEGLIFEDKVVEINTFKLKHKIPTHGFIIREKQKPRHILGDKFKEDGLSIAHIPAFKEGRDVVTEEGEFLSYLEYTSEPDLAGSYAYCSDTAYYENIVPFIRGVHLLYHEATFAKQDEERAKATKHSTAQQAASIAKLAEVKALYIGHMSARYNDITQHLKEAREVFENSNYAEEGLQVRIS